MDVNDGHLISSKIIKKVCAIWLNRTILSNKQIDNYILLITLYSAFLSTLLQAARDLCLHLNEKFLCPQLSKNLKIHVNDKTKEVCF